MWCAIGIRSSLSLSETQFNGCKEICYFKESVKENKTFVFVMKKNKSLENIGRHWDELSSSSQFRWNAYHVEKGLI